MKLFTPTTRPSRHTAETRWYYWLGAHALTHGGAAYLIASSLPLGIVETVLHAAIDHLKCEERITFHQDQALHIACKVAYVVLLPWVGRG